MGAMPTRVEDDGRHQEERTPDAGIPHLAHDPLAETLRDRGLDVGGGGRRESPDERGELVDTVRGAFEEFPRRPQERLRPPAPTFEDVAVR